ncbi:MAG: hypothetical protein LBD57_04350 [Endomicrobium sp.]|uniref:ATP-dependent DNA ligase n=1 Tax=Candidatus Endomicrobiellum cubanum TaxID=3242325 RepID=UPI00282564EB|nr:hypothetical protein [Endomicrobium sp.]
MKPIAPQSGINIEDMNRVDLIGHLYRVSEKIDGVRKIFYKNSKGEVRAYSRTYKPDPYLDHICLFFENNRFPLNTYYDCEIVDRKSYYGGVDSFELRMITNSKVSQEYETNKRDLMAVIFDYFQPDCMDITSKRTVKLQNIFTYFALEDPVIMIPIFGNVHGENTLLINNLAKIVFARGGEGLMLQDCDMPYIQGKSKNLIKVKRKEEFIGKIIDIEMALPTTKIVGGARAIVCKVDACTSPVRVGSGFTDEERYYIAEYRKELLGEEVEIEAFGISKNAKGETCLSMPIFKQFVNGNTTTLIHHFTRKEGLSSL